MEIMNQAVLTGQIKKKKVSRAKLIAVLLVLLAVGAAFFFSAMPREISANQSKVVMDSINNVFSLNLSMHIVRKIAHFVLFGGIGAVFTILFSFKFTGVKLFMYGFSAGTLMGIIDETHQMFVPGRGPQVKDVLIDASGAFVAVLLFATVITIYKKRKQSIA